MPGASITTPPPGSGTRWRAVVVWRPFASPARRPRRPRRPRRAPRPAPPARLAPPRARRPATATTRSTFAARIWRDGLRAGREHDRAAAVDAGHAARDEAGVPQGGEPGRPAVVPAEGPEGDGDAIGQRGLPCSGAPGAGGAGDGHVGSGWHGHPGGRPGLHAAGRPVRRGSDRPAGPAGAGVRAGAVPSSRPAGPSPSARRASAPRRRGRRPRGGGGRAGRSTAAPGWWCGRCWGCRRARS